MESTMKHPPTHQAMLEDMASGFKGFVDRVLRGRSEKTILNVSTGLAALDVGVRTANDTYAYEPFAAIINNSKAMDFNLFKEVSEHKLFDFNPENFTLFGMDFPDFFKEFSTGKSDHFESIYSSTVAQEIGLPDLPYGGIIHFAHMGMALYDVGRTFKELWDDPALNHNVLKIMTHPEMGETVIHKGVMLSVMGLLHPLGPLVSLGVAYLCGHLVHSFFRMLEGNKETIQQMQDVPVLREIYNATGIKEWAEATERDTPEDMDPFNDDPPAHKVSRVQHAQTISSPENGLIIPA